MGAEDLGMVSHARRNREGRGRAQGDHSLLIRRGRRMGQGGDNVTILHDQQGSRNRKEKVSRSRDRAAKTGRLAEGTTPYHVTSMLSMLTMFNIDHRDHREGGSLMTICTGYAHHDP